MMSNILPILSHPKDWIKHQLLQSFFSSLSEIDWKNELRLILASLVLGGIM